MRRVWPSGADLATKSAPMWPLAPGRFSTTIGCAQIPASFGSMMRASVSAPPPGGNGTTMCTGFEGNPWESAPAAEKSNAKPANASRARCIRVSPGARPQHALAPTWNRAYALVDEFLDALAVAEVRNLLQRFAQDDAHFLVLAVGEEHEPLLAVLRKRDVPCRARSERFFGIEPFLHELAVRLEYLHPVALAVAHVDETVVRALDAMHRVAELLGRRRFRVVVAHGSVVRLVAVRTPVALHPAGIGVDHGHALVGIAVGDVRFVGFGIDPDLGHPSEILEAVAPGVLSVATQLHQEFPILGEFQDVGVTLAVAAEPHVALVIDVDPVRPFRPLVARSRAAPGSDQVAGLVEHHYGRGRAAALGDGRLQLEPLFVVVQPSRAAMNDPDVILLVDPHSDGPAEQPVIRQGLRPQRVHFKRRRLDRGSRDARLVFEQGLAGSERDQD